MQGPSLDLVDPEDNEGSEYSSQVAEIATGLYDETVKLSMESALGQYNNVSNDFTFLPSVTSTFDHTNTFDRWISHDNALKTWVWEPGGVFVWIEIAHNHGHIVYYRGRQVCRATFHLDYLQRVQEATAFD